MKAIIGALAAWIITPGLGWSTIVVTPYGPSAYSSDTVAMDAALGITGYAVEDFGDTTLISGLSYSLADPSAGPFTALPGVYNPAAFQGYQNDNWDNVYVLNNSVNNSSSGTRSLSLTFHVADGASSFGVGLGSFQSLSSPSAEFPLNDHELLVNGVSLGNVEAFAGWEPGLGKNAYLRIDATGGDVIHSVTFRNLEVSSSGVDLLYFDHVAVAAVPEPSTVAPLAFVTACLAAGRRRS